MTVSSSPAETVMCTPPSTTAAPNGIYHLRNNQFVIAELPDQEDTMTITDTPVDNGINLQALLDAREALDDDPSLARVRVAGDAAVGRTAPTATRPIEKFSGLGGEQSHRTEFGYDVDHPECFASEDHGPTPVEFVLVGLAGCLTAGVASVAQMRNIQLRSVTATLEADMDVLGVLGVDPTCATASAPSRVHFDIDADATPDDIEALVAQSQKRSAVYDIITNPTNVVVDVNR